MYNGQSTEWPCGPSISLVLWWRLEIEMDVWAMNREQVTHRCSQADPPDMPTSVATTSVTSTTPLKLIPFFLTPSGRPPALAALASWSSPVRVLPEADACGRFTIMSLSSKRNSVQCKAPVDVDVEDDIAMDAPDGAMSTGTSSTSMQSMNRRPLLMSPG